LLNDETRESPPGHDEHARGFFATATRYIETAFVLIADGPSRYAVTALGPRYSSPAEFLIITLIINGLASLGLHTAISSAVDESKTAEHISALSFTALASVAGILLWTMLASWSARLVRRPLRRDVLWRTTCYTTAYTLLITPLTSVWSAIVERNFDETDDLVRLGLPVFLILIVAFVAFIRGAARGLDNRRPWFVLVFLLLITVVGALGAFPSIPMVNTYLGEHAHPALNAAVVGDQRSLLIRSQSNHEWSPLVTVRNADHIELLLTVQNVSGVTVHNVRLGVEGPFPSRNSKYIHKFYSIISCAGCAHDDIGNVIAIWYGQGPFAVKPVSASMYRGSDYKHQLPVPNNQQPDAITTSRDGLFIGDIVPGSENAVQVVVAFDVVEPEAPRQPTVYDYPDAAPAPPPPTTQSSPPAPKKK
jgi:hypothetical protein